MHVGAPGLEPNAYFWTKTEARRFFFGQNSSETHIRASGSSPGKGLGASNSSTEFWKSQILTFRNSKNSGVQQFGLTSNLDGHRNGTRLRARVSSPRAGLAECFERNACGCARTRAKCTWARQESSQTLIFGPKLERDAHPRAETRARRTSSPREQPRKRFGSLKFVD